MESEIRVEPQNEKPVFDCLLFHESVVESVSHSEFSPFIRSFHSHHAQSAMTTTIVQSSPSTCLDSFEDSNG